MNQSGIERLIQVARIIEDIYETETEHPHERERLEEILSRIYAITG